MQGGVQSLHLSCQATAAAVQAHTAVFQSNDPQQQKPKQGLSKGWDVVSHTDVMDPETA